MAYEHFGPLMPISKYDKHFGPTSGAAKKALDAMVRRYGEKKGKSVFYATKNKRAKRGG